VKPNLVVLLLKYDVSKMKKEYIIQTKQFTFSIS